jgi:hypothetical protein
MSRAHTTESCMGHFNCRVFCDKFHVQICHIVCQYVHTRKRAEKVYSKEVKDFLERDDNSRCNPGKSDVKMSDNTKKQTRILTDYMALLNPRLPLLQMIQDWQIHLFLLFLRTSKLAPCFGA